MATATMNVGACVTSSSFVNWELGYSSPSDAIEEHDYEEVPMSDEALSPPMVKYSDESDNAESPSLVPRSVTSPKVPPPLPPMRKKTKNYAKRREVRSMSSSFQDLISEADIVGAGDLDLLKPVVNCVHKKEGCQWSDNLGKLKAHLNACKYDAVPCKLRCGARIARVAMMDHMETTCRNRHRQSMFGNFHEYGKSKSGSADCLATGTTGTSSSTSSSTNQPPPPPPSLHCKKCRLAFHTHRALRNHLSNGGCGLEMIPCDACGEKIPRGMTNAHKSSSCCKRTVSCQNCSQKMEISCLESHEKQCSSSGNANGSVAKRSARVMTSVAPQGLTKPQVSHPCPFKHVGCNFRGDRPGLDDHIKVNSSDHLAGVCALVVRQQEEIEQLRAAMQSLTTNRNGTLVWRIRDVRRKLRDARASADGVELTSGPFYSSEHGYKLSASVFLNGNGIGDGTHVSVYVKILPGEYDPLLQWPFPHNVSFTLYDQNPEPEKAINVVESFRPDPSWDNFKRPSSTSSPDALGFGFPMFIPHNILFHPGRHYIRDDTMFLRVKILPVHNQV